MRVQEASWRCCIPAAILAVFGLGAVALVRVLPQTGAAEPVAVFALEGDALASVIAAGGRILSPGGVPGSIIAIGDAPDFAAQLYAAGATLVLRADSAMGCASIPAVRTKS
ncbi:hypothetical protein [Dongia sp.]|uniref:hypothetical protein n=1 Tax=Dongia sp. TaxID=1977262 RepID=UPI0035B2F59D